MATDTRSGFTLIETAIVFTIVGLVSLGMFAIINPISEQAKLAATHNNMGKILKVLSAYVQHNNRLPCPADPDTSVTTQPQGMEVSSGANGSLIPNVLGSGGCRKGALIFNEGIVPFATLGTGLDSIKDGWGRYFTYRVSPVFALDPSPTATTVANAHARCRLPGIWTSGSTSMTIGASSRTGPKARFCCPPPSLIAADLLVQDVNGQPLWAATRDNTAGNYATVDTPTATTSFNPATTNVTAVAMILVSHGPNGHGAFLENGTRVPSDATTGTSEDENRDGDNVFSIRDKSELAGNGHFDDILVWKTQDSLYALLGKNSCAIP